MSKEYDKLRVKDEAGFSTLTSSEIKNHDLTRAAHGIHNLLYYYYGTSDWGRVKEWRVLDLGCGSRKTPRSRNWSGWPPYFCLLCGVNGAETYGIDLYPADKNDAQHYSHIVADLVSTIQHDGLPNLPQLSGRLFNIIHSSFLTGSSISYHLEEKLQHARLAPAIFDEKLLEQTANLLVENGILQLEEQRWRKQGGQLVSM